MTRNMNIWLLLNCEIRRTYALIHASKNKTAGIFPSKYSNNHLHYKDDTNSKTFSEMSYILNTKGLCDYFIELFEKLM